MPIFDDELNIQLTKEQKDIIDYVDKQIAKIPKMYNLTAENLNIVTLEQKLFEWNKINEVLISLDVQFKMNKVSVEEELKTYEAEKYSIIRKRENNDSIKKTQWLKESEIMKIVTVEFGEEYKNLRIKKEVTDAQLAYIRRRLESWQSYFYVLTSCSKLIVAQMNGLTSGKDANFLDQKLSESLN